jgi:hypothetical protein
MPSVEDRVSWKAETQATHHWDFDANMLQEVNVNWTSKHEKEVNRIF